MEDLGSGNIDKMKEHEKKAHLEALEVKKNKEEMNARLDPRRNVGLPRKSLLDYRTPDVESLKEPQGVRPNDADPSYDAITLHNEEQDKKWTQLRLRTALHMMEMEAKRKEEEGRE